jgi:hypothetical protein
VGGKAAAPSKSLKTELPESGMLIEKTALISKWQE